MAQHAKKLQVFVSSTYTDLREERQAAVEAILTAGHIPAGMELFAAGDRSQLEVIRRWIDESDVFMLILGGRYGSLDPASGKSYTELEYRHAMDANKPLFAVVANEDTINRKARAAAKPADVLEVQNHKLLVDFRALVTSKMVRFWDDTKDIKLAVLETLSEYTRREDLIGWIRGGEQANVNAIANQLAEAMKENVTLRLQLQSQPQPRFGGLTYSDLVTELTMYKLDPSDIPADERASLEHSATTFGRDHITALDVAAIAAGRLLLADGIFLGDPLIKPWNSLFIQLGLCEEFRDSLRASGEGAPFLRQLVVEAKRRSGGGASGYTTKG